MAQLRLPYTLGDYHVTLAVIPPHRPNMRAAAPSAEVYCFCARQHSIGPSLLLVGALNHVLLLLACPIVFVLLAVVQSRASCSVTLFNFIYSEAARAKP